MFRLSSAVLLCTMISIGSAYRVAAEDVTDADKARFQEIISSQIEAFRADDGSRAYSFAAPSIRSKFQTSEIFMTMVRRGYPEAARRTGLAMIPIVVTPEDDTWQDSTDIFDRLRGVNGSPQTCKL